ncbi:MAG: hypothetical protein BWY57_02021 [Betaproteobacteria bacterium ADurb.Bin341]|nr:MAG: hypothetical protein BWY57_02021 [Betaproteobacteria bacterium ADurb.Bin341]
MAQNSHVAPTCTFADVFNPAARANDQCFAARGPGPTAEMEYSPTADATPPRVIGSDHSLTDCSQQFFGMRAIISAACVSSQPQSHAKTLASGLPRATPCAIVAFTSAMISAYERCLQRSHCACCRCEAQLVGFSEAVMVKTPPSPGACVNTVANASDIQRRTSGCDVQSLAVSPAAATPRMAVRSGFASKKA